MTFSLTKHQASLKEYTVSVYQQGIFKTNIWRYPLPFHFHDPLTAGLVRCIPGDISGGVCVLFFLIGSVMLICKCHATAPGWVKYRMSSSWAYWFHLLAELVVMTCQSTGVEQVIS